MSASSRVGATALVSLLCPILIVSVSVGAFGGLGSAAVTSSSVTLSDSEPTPGSEVTVTVTATPTNGSATFRFSHAFNQSVGSTSDITTQVAGSSVTPLIEEVTANGTTVILPPDDVTAREQITITYTITTAETAGKTVSLSGIVTNLNTELLPVRSYTVTSDLPGDGSESNPYEISNASELQAMEGDLDANYTLVSGIDASQTAQFNDGRGFDPVGGPGFDENTPPPFTGTFDGNNNTITGLTIDRPDESNVGLFGVTGSGATLADVTLANVTVTGNENVGGLVGSHTRTLTNVTASGSVSGNRTVGGLVGLNDRGAIRTAKVSVNVTAERVVGGLVGRNAGGQLRTTRASGSVSGNRTVGGLVGDNDGPIQNARASGTVSGASEVGGLVGSSGKISFPPDPTIRHAFAVGSVTGNRKVGGVVGAGDNFGTGTVEQSYFDRQATDQSTSAGNATGLTTAQMQGSTAAENMNLGFGETWQTVSGGYPELIALSESNANANPDTTTSVTVTITLDSAPAGLQRFNVSVAGPSGSSITTVSAGVISGGSFEIFSGGLGDSTVTARGVDLAESVGQSSDPVRLYEAEFEFADTVERSDLTVTVTDLTTDNGAAIPHSRLTVTTAGENPVIVSPNPATDPDGDGQLEDVDGDGEATFDDAITLAFNTDDASENRDSFDFDGDGDVDFDDAISLAFAV